MAKARLLVLSLSVPPSWNVTSELNAAERGVGRAIAKRHLHEPRALEALRATPGRLREPDGSRRHQKSAGEAHVPRQRPSPPWLSKF